MKDKNISASDLLYELIRVIYSVGIFIVFLMVKDLKVRAICCITLSGTSFIEFIFNKFFREYFENHGIK